MQCYFTNKLFVFPSLTLVDSLNLHMIFLHFKISFMKTMYLHTSNVAFKNGCCLFLIKIKMKSICVSLIALLKIEIVLRI